MVTEEFVGEVVGKTVGDFVVGEIVVGEFVVGEFVVGEIVVGEFVVGEFVGKFVGEIVGDSVGADDVGDVEGARVTLVVEFVSFAPRPDIVGWSVVGACVKLV